MQKEMAKTSFEDRLFFGQRAAYMRPTDVKGLFMAEPPTWHGTTILSVRKGNRVVIAGDGQVSLGQTIIKGNARKVRPLGAGQVIGGFAGATADAMTLFERLEAKLEQYPSQLVRACVDMTGTGDVLEPEKGIIAIGSGGNYALAAARALADGDLDAEAIARKAMAIAAEICVYTNNNLTVESLATA